MTFLSLIFFARFPNRFLINLKNLSKTQIQLWEKENDIVFSVVPCTRAWTVHRARVQDALQELERIKAAAKQSKVRPTTHLFLTFPPFPVGHPAHELGTTYRRIRSKLWLYARDRRLAVPETFHNSRRPDDSPL